MFFEVLIGMRRNGLYVVYIVFEGKYILFGSYCSWLGGCFEGGFG